ncbi:hypothetical protein [Kibdelosporangium philippinense]|uniref:hypothetical protein n=1 Tax=Kibdelosporangium philippinense TaxID=211113 RepID=UPI0036191DD9
MERVAQLWLGAGQVPDRPRQRCADRLWFYRLGRTKWCGIRHRDHLIGDGGHPAGMRALSLGMAIVGCSSLLSGLV